LKGRLLILLTLLAGALHAQTDLDQWLATSRSSTLPPGQAKEQIHSLVQSLSETKGSDLKLLRKTFNRIHGTFLKKYKAYSDFDEVFTSGQYDCLTATALFSHVLDQLTFSYNIIETNYHIFLVVQTTGGDVLIETTDRFGGFVTGKETISQRIGNYGQNKLEVGHHDGKHLYQYSFNLCQKISPEKLVGLMYFNQAVKAYNLKEFEKSSIMLETAYSLYASSRCDELGIILIRTLVDSSMNEEVKTACLARLRSHWAKNTQPLASN
jgi:hypothetical protein